MINRVGLHLTEYQKVSVCANLIRFDLEAETHRNLEVIWLMGKLTPDFKTIADFRKDNPSAIRRVCREFVLLCKRLDLFGGELVAIDGSKFKAQNSKKRNFNEKKLQQLILRIDSKIDAYLEELDQADQQEIDQKPLTAEELRKKIEQLQKRKQSYEQINQQLKESGESQISLTDPDSRSMKTGQGTQVSYNVQIAVDEKHKLILDHLVTNDVTDRGQLSNMAIRAKQILGVEDLEALADSGYSDCEEVKQCQEEAITVYVPKPQTSANLKRGMYRKEDFTYDGNRDCYICPAGEELLYRYESEEQGRRMKYYTTAACKGCDKKKQCTTNKKGRRIMRLVEEHFLEQAEQRVKNNPGKMRKRNELAEHPFGTMKVGMSCGYFLMRGIKKVGAEMGLTVLAYNIKRVVNILGVRKMIEEVA